MKKRLYFVTDIDGTLISNGIPLDVAKKAKLKALTDIGVEIVFATGRNFEKLKHIIGDISFNYLSICCNGAEIYDKSGSMIFCANLQFEDQIKILQYLEKKDALYLLYTIDKTFVRKVNDKNIRLLQLGETIKGDFIDIVNEALIYNKLIYENNEEEANLFSFDLSTTKIEIIDSYEQRLSEMAKYINANFKVTVQSSFKFNIEVTPFNISKGNSLRRMIKKDDAFVISAGDGMNDISMFEASDFTIAMNQAEEYLKKIATRNLDINEDLLDIVGGIINEF